MGQFAVIGLGNFGFFLATRLYEKGHDVLAVDTRADVVQEIKDQVSQAVVADATDRRAMEALGLKEMDAAVVCIGSVLSDSILATLVMKDIGVSRVIAKSISEPHGRILEKVGASEIVFPEKDMGLSLAERLHDPNMLDFLPLTEGYSIIELAPTKRLVGQSLQELDLINRYGVQVIAVKEIVPDRLNMIPTGKFVVKDSDILIILGPNEALERLRVKG